LSLNVSDDNRARLQNNLSAMNWALDFSVHDDPFSLDAAVDTFGRDNEGRALQVALDLPIDLNQALSGNAAYNFEPFGYNRFSPPCEHGSLLRNTDR
jgi:hypothetical protein